MFFLNYIQKAKIGSYYFVRLFRTVWATTLKLIYEFWCCLVITAASECS